MKRVILSFILIVVGGQAAADDQNQYLYKLSPGTRLVLQRPVVIPLGTATVYFQGGRVVSEDDVDEYYPHCALLSRVVSVLPQTVAAGTFTITRVFPFEEEHNTSGRMLPRYAGSGAGFIAVGLVLASNETSYYFSTRLLLRADAMPDIMYLECRQISEYDVGEHLRIGEFRQAVGSLMSLR
ncbi:MAG TPA: hypothetical protein ENI80_03855 [Acidiferrobacteraceae bacterium]|nr:hypothetical protein [Acidiferrobacteraceae bacterium]